MDDQKKERCRRKDGETCIMRDTGSGGKLIAWMRVYRHITRTHTCSSVGVETDRESIVYE